MTYDQARIVLSRILEQYGPNHVKEANQAVKNMFHSHLSQVKSTGACEYTYYISTREEGEDWELSYYTWDFFSRSFS